MGLLAKILGAVPRDEMGGIRLDITRPFWEVSGRTDFPAFLRGLAAFLPEGCILYLEGGSASGSLLDCLREQSVPEQAHVAYGTIWPRPPTYHIPATKDLVFRLAEDMERRASPELAVHAHVYRGQTVLLEWHDAFTQPMLLSGDLPEMEVRTFAERLGMSYKKGVVEPSASPNGGPATQLGKSDLGKGPPSVS